MIYSISTYLKRIITQYLRAFLSNSYILSEEVLNDFPKSVRSSFVNTYCTDSENYKSVHIPVQFTFNAAKPNPYATILIQEKSGRELQKSDQSIGYNVNSTKGKGTQYHTEESHLHYSSKYKLAFYQVKHYIYKLHHISNYSGRVKVINNRIYLLNNFSATIAKANDNPVEEATIYYISSEEPKNKRKYNVEGYDATEDYTIDIITSNIDTLRCLGAIMKAIFIAMRLESLQENRNFYIPKITEAGVDLLRNINRPSNSTSYSQLFYKRFTVNYIVTYTLPQKFGYLINKAITFPRYKSNNLQASWGK